MDYGFEYVQAKGIVTEAEYPYVAVDQKCAKDGGPFKVSTHTDIKAGDCNGLLTALMIEPVSVAVDAATWSYYSGGILKRCQ